MIILASASPRRKELLHKIVDVFEIVPSSINEDYPTEMKKLDVAEYLATRKALSVYESHKNDTIIGSDTIIVFNNKIYGKPHTKDEAKEMLKEFSNNTHYVVTGVCVVSSKQTLSFSSISEVTFYNLSDEEIDNYLEDDEYKDKAGSYAIQGKASLFIKKINGDYNSIIGLPVAELNRILKNFF